MNDSKAYWDSPSTQKTWVEGDRKGRGLRILPKNVGYFVHVTSRTRGQKFLLGDEEKRSFLFRMRQWSEFSGIGVLTHCLMSNHFHMLLWVPVISKLPHHEVENRLRGVWPEEKVEAWIKTYARRSKKEQEAMDQLIVDRMGDLPSFMRVLKQSFSNWYNHREGCKGTFWEGRYRSVVVENNPLALMSVSAYIDLNPLRARLVSDPMDTVWSGYGSACGGDSDAQKGLEFLVSCCRGIKPASLKLVQNKPKHHNKGHSSVSYGWADVQKSYRIWLYAKGDDGSANVYSREKNRSRGGIDPSKVFEEFEQNGEVPPAKLLLQKWRCYTRGVGLGSPMFLENLLQQYRSCFGPKRSKAGIKLKTKLPGLESMRNVD